MSVAALHIEAAKLGLSDARYREILREVAGVESSKDLSPDADRAVWRRLKELGCAKTRQARFVWVLWNQLQAHLSSKERRGAYLCGFIRKAAGIPIDDLTRLDLLKNEDFRIIIEALKKRIKEEEKRAEAVPF